jgi:hypothetical protein
LADSSKRENVLQKLRGRSLEELRERGMQFLRARAERYGLSKLDRIPSDEQLRRLVALDVPVRERADEFLLRQFVTRSAPRFFSAFHSREQTRKELRQRFAGANQSAVVERSNRIANGRFDLLGLHDLDFGTPINWHLEPIAGTVAPLVHWSRIDYLDAGQTGDKKITWELNRHQYFATLGRAYWFTGDENYAKTFAEHIEIWINQNPPKLGINWASSLEVGFRSISWLWALHFFKESSYLTPSLFGRVVKLLYVHALHLENYLSTYFSPNTHLTGEALALFYLGLLLPEFRAAQRWRTMGESILLSELDRHVLPDGVYFEQSSYYHRYTADFYIHMLLLLEANKQQVSPKLTSKLTALLDHLLYITRPDGSSPLFGDDDGGKLMMLDERPLDDFRSTLVTAAVLFERGDYKYVGDAATEESLWLLGTQRLREFDSLLSEPPKQTSRAFEAGGYYVMRDGWTKEANYMLADSGPLGGLKNGHAHADALSYELAVHGRTVLVDPGTYTYTGSKEDRDYFRSSSAHNTITIDSESSSVCDGPFSWRCVANARCLDWISRSRFDFFAGEHDGYLRLEFPALHRRNILFLKKDYWIVVDEIHTAGPHQFDLNFHFTEDAMPVIDTVGKVTSIRERGQETRGLDIIVVGGEGAWQIQQSARSRCYRQRHSAPLLNFSGSSKGSLKLVTLLLPRNLPDSQAVEVLQKDRDVIALELHHGATTDLILIGDGQPVTGPDCCSDFHLSWMRFGEDSQMLEEFVLIGGRNFSFQQREIVKNSELIQYVAARRYGGELRGETNLQSPWYASFPMGSANSDLELSRR